MDSSKVFLERQLTKYLFFTGKGGVGKTSTACALAIHLADSGKTVMLVSTDPASNLQDVFGIPLDNKGVSIPGVPHLVVANFEPEAAAKEYRESVVAPFRGLLPEAAIANMEEQLSGSCTVEIAAFNEFTHFVTDSATAEAFDHIVFDTAPTGHTLRMLELPAAWSTFIDGNKSGASCLGQLAGLDKKRATYAQAVDTLCNGDQTTLVLVSRPEEGPLKEAARASEELKALGICNQVLMVNGLLENVGLTGDQGGSSPNMDIASRYYQKQQGALQALPVDLPGLALLPCYYNTLKPFSVMGIDNLRHFFSEGPGDRGEDSRAGGSAKEHAHQNLEKLIEDLHISQKRVIFTMGKGGVGKTTLASEIAHGLWARGATVHLTTTDPAAHIMAYKPQSDTETPGLKVSYVDEGQALEAYKNEVLATARTTMTPEELDYLEEDLKSPCTQEIAVFRAFADLVEGSDKATVVIDTAPTGHTLLLLDATLSYHREIERSKGIVPESVGNLLPKLRDPNHTTVVIVTLAEPTPVHEASRLSEDLDRAGIHAKWWVVNASLAMANTQHPVLAAKAHEEWQWIETVSKKAQGHYALVPWQ